MRKKLLTAAVACTALVATSPLTAAGANTPQTGADGVQVAPAAAAGTSEFVPRATVVNRQVIAPFSLSVSAGTVFVADGGTGLVSRLAGDTLRTVVTGPHIAGGDVAGLDVSGNGREIAYTATTNQSHKTTYLEVLRDGRRQLRADLSGYEARVDPDRITTYGILNPSHCVADYFAKHSAQLGPVNHHGTVDSHPYAVASVGHGWVVADAGGNDLLRVDRAGRVSTLTVLPRQPLRITAAIATAMHLPGCAVGFTYNFEAVPTDVEQGQDGSLYVTVLAGGAESPALGARGKVYRVDPCTGRTTEVASQLSGATNLALQHGRIYVAELFAGRISVIDHGRPQTYVRLAHALSVEAGRRGLWAGTLAPMDKQGKPTGPGTIVRVSAG